MIEQNPKLVHMTRARWADPKYRKKQSQQSKALWKDKDYRAKYETPEFKQKIAKAIAEANKKRKR